jgi:hypothetical protein
MAAICGQRGKLAVLGRVEVSTIEQKMLHVATSSHF